MAAGKGTRMKSRLPKVLHRLGGRALLAHVAGTAARIGARDVVVVTGHGADQVEAAMAGGVGNAAVRFARQEPQLGTGHAVQQAAPLLSDDGTVVVLSGDVPLIGEETLRALVAASAGGKLALLTIEFDDPTGYGRVIRAADDGEVRGEVQAVVEHKDATEAQRAVREIYSGVMAVPARLLKGWLGRLNNDNAQGEYYLTDVVKLAAADGVPVVAHVTTDALQVAGINSPAQLAALERAWQLRQANALMEQGVRLADPSRFDLRGKLACGMDVEIDVGCVFEGDVTLGDGVRVGPHCVIRDAQIAAGAVIHPFTHIEGASVGAGTLVGPFARLRPGADLGEGSKVGNFCEVKNGKIAEGAKVNHLTYIGDAVVGAHTNIGAGTITCNYDGVNKHETRIGANAFIGSNSSLVAPVQIGDGAYIASGSVITDDVPGDALAFGRARQEIKPDRAKLLRERALAIKAQKKAKG